MTQSNIDLKPNEYLSSCNNRDIISFDSRDPTYINKFFSLVTSAFQNHIIHSISNSITQKLANKSDAKLWFENGEKCEVLQAGSSGWHKGKMKLKVTLVNLFPINLNINRLLMMFVKSLIKVIYNFKGIIMSKDLEILNNDDVIAISQDFKGRFEAGNTLKIKQLLEEYKQYIHNSNVSSWNGNIFKEHIKCEVLSQDGKYKGWRKGKIKFVVQFEPEEAEINNSPNSLDDIRQQIDTAN